MAFVEDTGAGAAALRLVSRGGWTYHADTAKAPPRFWWDTEHSYRSFLAGPVATPDHVLGLLTLDALAPGELAQVDLILVRLLADLLATALSV